MTTSVFLLSLPITQGDLEWCNMNDIHIQGDRETKEILVAGVKYNVAGAYNVFLTARDKESEMLLQLRFSNRLTLT